jgi:acetylornithine deacetylase/succinyl-diaminopimelate desuccinylase-like protein
VAIDSRSFNVGEFEGDRKIPSDMQEILACANEYLSAIGFATIKINDLPPSADRTTPIMMAEIAVSPKKPTILFYAHLDKQPYMDDGRFLKWDGIAPTQLTWNEDKSRAYGRGAADDLSGVIAIGMTVDAILKTLGHNSQSIKALESLPCNLKVIFETEEECGSQSLIDQIKQNHNFFKDTDCVLITDVINPDTGVPGLTTSLRGLVQMQVSLKAKSTAVAIDEQTALYKLLATLINDDHSLALKEIAQTDRPVTEAEYKGYEQIPTSVASLREMAGLLPRTTLTVPSNAADILIAQLRKSFANIRPGHRVAGSIIFGSAGARLTFANCSDKGRLSTTLQELMQQWNPFNLEIILREVSSSETETSFDLILRSAEKDPHSGMNGGPIPIAELQLAKMLDRLVLADGTLTARIAELSNASEKVTMKCRSLHTDHDQVKTFDDPTAKAIVEIRLAPGNSDPFALEALKTHLIANTPEGFELEIQPEKGGSPWMTGIKHPVFPLVMTALEKGYGRPACLFGCGGSIPFVAKLTDALGDIQPVCLGAYDPQSRMHEPGESLSMVDLLGCSRSMVHIVSNIDQAYSQTP